MFQIIQSMCIKIKFMDESITLETLNKICVMCGLQPGDIIEVFPTDEEKIKYKL